MKKIGIFLVVMILVFGSVSMAQFNSFGSNVDLGLNDTISSIGSSNGLELNDTVSSIGSSVYIIMLIVNAIVYLGIPIVIGLIFCAIKAKKQGGFGNAFKKSFLKVFLITLAVIIGFEILINIIL